MSILSDNIRARRLAQGITQEQLGRLAGGRSVNQINGYERARSKPSPPVLADIAKALKTTPDTLLGVESRESSERSISAIVDELRNAVASALNTSAHSIRISLDFT
jgi:transcriptional regulator with XRE-family HTH domain